MSAIDFHTHIDDTVAYACRLLRKVVSLGNRVQVRASAPTLDRLDVALWTFSPLAFLTHARWGQGGSVVRRSSVLLMNSDDALIEAQSVAGHTGVLVNVGTDFDPQSPWVSGFDRVVEIVGLSDSELTLARQRYRQYRDHGAHDLKLHQR